VKNAEEKKEESLSPPKIRCPSSYAAFQPYKIPCFFFYFYFLF
jgi:hypothetical protein